MAGQRPINISNYLLIALILDSPMCMCYLCSLE